MKKRSNKVSEQAEIMAIQALSYLAGDPERLARFLALTGVSATEIRAAAAAPGFLAGVLEYLVSEEALLTGFAAEHGYKAQTLEAARLALGGGWERDVP